MVKITSDRAKAIEAARNTTEAQSEFRQYPVVIAGKRRMLPVFRLPLQLLAFNIRNGRFAAELKEKERDLSRKLDPLSTQDELIIQKLLLDLDPPATELLREDLRKIGQTEPGIVTHEGYVINGNRRMAVLKELDKEEPTGKYQYIDVQILPPEVDPKDLWRIEAGLQLSRDKRLDYGPINDLLKIREGLTAGLSRDEISATLYGSTGAEEIEEKDLRLKLIDNYLTYINRPEQYTVVKKGIEHFINLQNLLRWLEKKQGVGPKDRHKWLMVAFEMLRTESFGHMEIRDLRKIYEVEDARDHLKDNIIPEPEKALDENKKNAIREQFDTAMELVAIAKDVQKPEKLVSRAERALTALLKHKKAVVKEKKLYKRVTALKNLAIDLDKACSARKG